MPATIFIRSGDITKLAVDAIVNAANSIMLGGGGVDGAIHRAAGKRLREACLNVPAIHGIRCPVGEARITPGFDLPATFVIHTVGPRYHQSADPPGELARAYRSSFALAESHGLRTIAVPAISCGSYGYPANEAANIALDVASEREWNLAEIHFVLFTADTRAAWDAAAAARNWPPSPTENTDWPADS